jgi:acetyl-CoA carboxylase carboxyltransferase component
VTGSTAVDAMVEVPQKAVRLGAIERLERLCDPGSLEVIRSTVAPKRPTASSRPGDGVVGGLGRVDGRPVACYAQDVSHLAGALGQAHAETIHRVMEIAGRSRVPIVSFIESGGARLQEGTAALGGYGKVFRQNVALSRVVPQVSVIGGLSAGGGCYSPALTDFVVMTEDAAMFLTGPQVVRQATGEEITTAELGGHRLHARNGVCEFVTHDDGAAATLVRDLLGYLPQHFATAPPIARSRGAELEDPSGKVPTSPREVYDMRSVVRGIVDVDSFFEIGPRWARNILTGFARLDGRAVGVIANQPRHIGGVLDVEASQKGARFVEQCDVFGLPLVVLVDTPGFMPGQKQEQAGVIRHGASLVRAFSKATVPRMTVVVRKAYGGAYIAMNSKDLGASLVFAWPAAEIGIMSAHSAVGIVHRRDLEEAADPAAMRDALAATYRDEYLGAESAAAEGFVDEVIEPVQTRSRLAWALGAMCAGGDSTGACAVG